MDPEGFLKSGNFQVSKVGVPGKVLGNLTNEKITQLVPIAPDY